MPVNGRPSVTEILSITATLGAAELLAFAGGKIQVVPPPGGGKLIWVVSAFVQYNFGTVDFADTPALTLKYGGSNTPAIPVQITFLTGNGASFFTGQPGEVNSGLGGQSSLDLNQGINLTLDSGAFALHGIGAASITAAGTGYVVGDTGTITTGGGDATYRITSVGALGAVTGFVITFPGSGYATGAGQATATGGAQPGVGINFTVNVTALVNGDGTLKVTTLYQVIDVP